MEAGIFYPETFRIVADHVGFGVRQLQAELSNLSLGSRDFGLDAPKSQVPCLCNGMMIASPLRAVLK